MLDLRASCESGAAPYGRMVGPMQKLKRLQASIPMICPPSTRSPRTVIIAAPHDVVADCRFSRDWLSSEELHRLGHFRSALDQRRFEAAHLLKRSVLARQRCAFQSQPLQRLGQASPGPDGSCGARYRTDARPGWVGRRSSESCAASRRTVGAAILDRHRSHAKAQRTAFALDPRLLQMCASEDGFQARSPEFAVSGSWCPADDHHLIAVAGGGIQRLWHISRTSKDLGIRLCSSVFWPLTNICEIG
ncbi:hypothetical protein Avi_7498 (plasmid) [Allorhizobium ampelinum S4]|uniref:Uncharacterized protein n=1 Tax=Allorhizobium ampelinum (strain ATCC BAA-846 / DSM 112012 / S4) TaxID=311402 RepID=B9K5H3_ALLAM|nr:hypothetical protein Avi_7498 [Allorhizobium ampelinum S4]